MGQALLAAGPADDEDDLSELQPRLQSRAQLDRAALRPLAESPDLLRAVATHRNRPTRADSLGSEPQRNPAHSRMERGQSVRRHRDAERLAERSGGEVRSERIERECLQRLRLLLELGARLGDRLLRASVTDLVQDREDLVSNPVPGVEGFGVGRVVTERQAGRLDHLSDLRPRKREQGTDDPPPRF